MNIETIKSYLDQNEQKHFVLKYEAHTNQEISKSPVINQGSLVRNMIVKVDGQLKMAVAPNGFKVDLNKMKSSLRTNQVFPLPIDEFKQKFPRFEPGTVPPLPELFDGMEVIAPKEIGEAEDVVFRVASNDTFIGVSSNTFDELAQARELDFTVPVGDVTFKASPNHIVPKVGVEELKKKGRCILGYSMENEKFEPQRFKAIVDWINTRFQECIVLIGDTIHRNTLMINRGLTPDEALAESKRMADEIMQREELVLNSLKGGCTFRFMPGSYAQQSVGYLMVEQTLWNLFYQDDTFNHSINKFASTFLSRRNQNDAQLRLLSCTYLIEELAIVTMLIRDGWDIFVYPGSLDPFVEITQGLHPHAPEELKKLRNVVLGLKKRGHKIYC